MRLNPVRIVSLSVLLGLVGVAVVGIAGRNPPALVDPHAAPWIGLPRGGMDASELPVRQAVNWGEWGQGRDTLAYQCGYPERSYLPERKERYIAHIGESVWKPAWTIVMDVDRDVIDIAWRHGGAGPPPPPPPPPGHPAHVGFRELIVPVAHARKSRVELEKIRALWDDEVLWHAPQGESFFSCLDGNPVILEACIDGRYAVRMHNCDAAGNAAIKLWRAFNELLPPPPEPELR